MDDTVSLEQLKNGFAGLLPATRTLVTQELERALRDTSVEYHQTKDPEICSKLHMECCALATLVNACKSVSKEFEDINGG